ncbi:hypothetical protein VaNZ11_009228 [Volvox africanus]|uniref:Uncharacterized protein n=1 Tax=Volvox africanus TaxID=51714 RepID=A0ABQ5S7U4_9CHLO|nr:hypothetical protein VaNZ11_009228 [Volvox africanus]
MDFRVRKVNSCGLPARTKHGKYLEVSITRLPNVGFRWGLSGLETRRDGTNPFHIYQISTPFPPPHICPHPLCILPCKLILSSPASRNRTFLDMSVLPPPAPSFPGSSRHPPVPAARHWEELSGAALPRPPSFNDPGSVSWILWVCRTAPSSSSPATTATTKGSTAWAAGRPPPSRRTFECP